LRKYTDLELGMKRAITRRDILHGFGAVAASTFVPGEALANKLLSAEAAGKPYYPPALTGMRGNHDGSFDVAHMLAREGKNDWGPVEELDTGVYDLVIAGAGLSGLAAAHFYQKENPNARILLLDNHDDFGGHAKRNEFKVGDRTLIGYGGSQSLESPSSYPKNAKVLLDDLGIDIKRLGDAYDQSFFKRHGLAAGVHFNEKEFSKNALVRYELGGLRYLPLADSGNTAKEAVSQMPISDAARTQMLRLLTTKTNQTGLSGDDLNKYLYSISYHEFLEKNLDIHEPEVFAILQDHALDYGTGIEAIYAGSAMDWGGQPGALAAGLSDYEEDEPYIHHFPDGNASVARMLVRKLIPGVAPGSTPEDVVKAAFDYSELDRETSAVRLRLNSTVVRVKHEGDATEAKCVSVDYVRDGRAFRVTAKHCILACYNSIIPSLCPELPAGQKEALAMSVKSPILYTNVVLHNWRAFKNLGVGAVLSSGSYHPLIKLDFPVSFGGQQYPDDPDEPIIVTMERFVHRNNEGLSPREQRRLGRHELLATSFETMERNIRQQLADQLSDGGFDPAKDIAGITVNRWAHGYADGFSSFGDPRYDGRNDERRPNVRGRKPFGRVAIANSDAGGRAMYQSAVEQAHRAVGELN
jgi:spermidine dehydrogenase